LAVFVTVTGAVTAFCNKIKQHKINELDAVLIVAISTNINNSLEFSRLFYALDLNI